MSHLKAIKSSMENNRKHSYVCNRFICWIMKVFLKVAFYIPNSGKHLQSGYHSNTLLILKETCQIRDLLAGSNLRNTFTMRYVSYSPGLYFHSINYCIPDCKDQQPDATSTAASV